MSSKIGESDHKLLHNLSLEVYGSVVLVIYMLSSIVVE